ncbi:MAG: hypothetical protein ACI4XG_13970, partial [Bradyrhizobium sp.]
HRSWLKYRSYSTWPKSWRVTRGGDARDAHGRLYAAFETALVRTELAAAELLLDAEVVSASSGKVIHRLVASKRR